MSIKEMEQRAEANKTVKTVVVQSTHLMRMIEKLRLHAEDPTLDGKSRGMLGNIIGELKALHRADEQKVWSATADVLEIIDAYKSDPVIKAYLDSQAGWQEKLDTLRSRISSAFTSSEFDGPFDDD